MIRLLTRPLVIVALLATATLTWAFSGGPPDGVSGAPGDNDCTACHSSFEVNSGDGVLTITAPAEYAPGDTLTIQVALSQAGQQRWGFESTVLDGGNNPVGELLVTDATNTQKSVGGDGREYLKHTSSGTYNGTADASLGWSFDWVAPATDVGSVTFYVAGNAANGNFNNQGDFIYTTSQAVDPAAPPLCCTGMTGNVNNDPQDDVTLTDLTLLVNHLFVTFETLPCPAEANTSGDTNCDLTLTDLTALVNHLFVTFETIAQCSDFDESACN